MQSVFRISALATVASFALLLAPATTRADELTRITGQVLTQKNQPIAGALVVVRSPASVEVRTKTDRNGNFVLLGQTYGPVQLLVVASNYDPCPSSTLLQSGDDLHATYRLSAATATVSSMPELSRRCSVQSWRSEPFDRYVIH